MPKTLLDETLEVQESLNETFDRARRAGHPYLAALGQAKLDTAVVLEDLARDARLLTPDALLSPEVGNHTHRILAALQGAGLDVSV